MKVFRVVMLSVVLLISLTLVVAACGSDEDATAELTAALDKIEQSVAKLPGDGAEFHGAGDQGGP